MEQTSSKNTDVGRRCTLVLKRTDGRVDFQTGIFMGESETHFRIMMAGNKEVLFLRMDVQKIEFDGGAKYV